MSQHCCESKRCFIVKETLSQGFFSYCQSWHWIRGLHSRQVTYPWAMVSALKALTALRPASTMHRASSLLKQWNDIIHKSPYDILTIAVLSDCLHFLSTAVIKHRGQKQPKGERADGSLQFQVIIHCFGGMSRQELQAGSYITSMIKSREILRHTSALGCLLCSAQHSTLTQSILPALEMALPTVCRVFLRQLSLLRQCPNNMPTGQPSVNNPTLRLSLLRCAKLAIETITGDDKRKIIYVYFIYATYPFISQIT